MRRPASAVSAPGARRPAVRGRRLRWSVALALLAVPAAVLLYGQGALEGWALYSEDQVLGASVLHPLFNTPEHFAEEHWRPNMSQHERLSGLTLAYNATFQGLAAIGLTPFLESSSLIGLLRHQGHMPWEVDGDVGVSQEQCRERGATKQRLEAVLDPDFEVLKFACACEEDCEGDNKRMAGRVAHRRTGVVIDIFMYALVGTLRDWQRAPAVSGVEWWERVDDHADYTFPAETLLPLRNGSFEGVQVWLPNQPREFLSWEYGQCLGVHVWPWRLFLYCPVSVWVPVAILVKGAVMLSGTRGSPWLSVLFGAYAALALDTFRGGITLAVLFLVCLCEMAAVLVLPELLGAAAAKSGPDAAALRSRHRRLHFAAIFVLVMELRGCFGQLFCQFDDVYLHPLRPKMWTLCLFGNCWDF